MHKTNRRDFLRITGAAALGAALSPYGALGAAPARRRPNVLFVFSDMQRAYSMGCYGDANARTPVLDAFAKQGARFDAAMSNTPVCCPYRACLMTGQYAHHHGMMSNSVDFVPKVKCVAETFRDAGYETGYTGKWHLEAGAKGDANRRLGFPAAQTPYGYYQTNRKSEVVTDVALKFIAEKSKGPAPWLLFVSYILPHGPYKAPDGYREHFTKITLAPNVPAGAAAEYARRNLPDYYGMIESLDVEFGRILKALDEAGAADDTVVAYSSDHGDMVGCHGL
ncbi:MAG: sulfatase-like hydrolase/transferase, partial [Planctomycetes bacterium]|nr:sulfatase-like hydrolase/transferase [Planctomycetota bacterium]